VKSEQAATLFFIFPWNANPPLDRKKLQMENKRAYALPSIE
jgi:hypothetical protein